MCLCVCLCGCARWIVLNLLARVSSAWFEVFCLSCGCHHSSACARYVLRSLPTYKNICRACAGQEHLGRRPLAHRVRGALVCTPTTCAQHTTLRVRACVCAFRPTNQFALWRLSWRVHGCVCMPVSPLRGAHFSGCHRRGARPHFVQPASKCSSTGRRVRFLLRTSAHGLPSTRCGWFVCLFAVWSCETS